MRVLNLVLKGNWYDMIVCGEKTEEYREIKPYWIKRFVNNYEMLECNHEFKHFNAVCFHRGYSKITEMFSIEDITIGLGNPKWGAPNKEVFIIKLGKRLR